MYQIEERYKCPECGGDVDVVRVATYPATTCYRCTKCSYHHDVSPELKVVEKIAPTKEKGEPNE